MVKDYLNIPEQLDGLAWQVRAPYLMKHSHTHDELELNVVVEGRGSYMLGDRCYELRPRTMAWLFSGQDHLLASYSADFRMWVVVFSTEMINRCALGKGRETMLEDKPSGHFCRMITRHAFSAIERTLQETLNLRDDPVFHNACLQYLLLNSWREFSEAEAVPGHREVHPAVEKAARAMQDDELDLPLEDIARHAGLSPSRLSRLFHQQTGVTFAEFRNQRRLNRFVEIYGLGQRVNMLEAAFEAGFGSYAQFHRVFKQLMGVGPAEYRRKLV